MGKIKNLCIKINKNQKCKQLRKKLIRPDFTIISNNCWGSFIYQKYGLEYRSPTVGLYLLGHDFVKLAANWDHYFVQKLEFIPWEKSRYYPKIRDMKPYPVAKLDDIEIYFMHYLTEQEAAQKWYRRVKRVNPEHMIFKLSQREGCSRKDVEDFMELPLKYKVCFAYDDVPGVVYIPALKGWIGDEQPIVEQYFDECVILNKK
ncbi:MAG: DUF1919 domain-containing protein [Lachnospiraceae bacterium]|nr:DUF1919 domain-containing protein [Lachnospiraceae bacterium]